MPSESAIWQARQSLEAAGYSTDEAASIIAEVFLEQGDPMGTIPQQGLRGSQQAAAFALPAAGGALGRIGVQQLAPRLGALGRAAGTATGVMSGDVAGRAVTGQPQDIRQSAAAGAVGGAFDIGVGLLTRGAALTGGVRQRAVTEAAKRDPIRAGAFVKRPGEIAELSQAESAAARTAELLSPSRAPLPSVQTAQRAIGQFDASVGRVDKKPILDKIDDMLSKRARPAVAEEAAANRTLLRQRELIEKFPVQSLDDMETMLQRLRGPVKAQLGKTGAPTHKKDIIEIQRFVRKYRDDLMTRAGIPEGPEAFALASKEIDAIKRFRNLIVDASGNLRKGAEGTWRQALSRENHAVARLMQRFDEATGGNVYQKARELALRNEWTPTEEAPATFILSIIARAIKRTARGVAKTGITAGQLAGPIAGGAKAAFEQEMGARRRPQEVPYYLQRP